MKDAILDTKMKELILYISHKSESDETFGSTKLNKLLFFSDFSCYWETGKAITGQEYQKLEHGPAPRFMVSIVDEMKSKGELVIANRSYHNNTQKKPIALRLADLSLFTGREISIVDKVLDLLKDYNGSKISNLSHEFPCWQMTVIGETIPYESALLVKRELTPIEKQWAFDIDMSEVEGMITDNAVAI
jgi:uncharacterized phage-associated protein